MAKNNQIIASISANLLANTGGGILGANIANITSNLQTFISNNGSAVKSVSIQSSTSSGFLSNYSLTLPPNTGSSGQVLTTDGTGTLSWATAGAVTGSSIANGNSNVNIPTANGNVIITAVGNTTMTISGTGANITGTANVSSNANVGNLGTSGLIVATGNITGGNLITGGLVSATGNVTGGNLITGGLVSATGNVTGGNLTTSGILNSSGTGISSFAGNINMNGQWVGNIGYAVANTDAASKQYVDEKVSSGISYHTAVNAATTTTLAIATGGTTAYNQPNGAGNGIGSYISTTGTFTTIDGVTINGSTSTRILVKDEANGAWNGVYNYTNATAITRTSDTNTYGPNPDELSLNDYFFTTGGTVNAGTAFILTAPAGTIIYGTSVITFSVFSTSQVYTGGTGITVSGTVISANASQTQITAVGTLGLLAVSGNATVGNLIGPLANGNSNVNIPAANGNVTISVAGNSNVIVVTGKDAVVGGNVQLGAVNSNSSLIFNANTFQTKLYASNALAANYSLYLPSNVASSNGLYLVGNTDGTLSFGTGNVAQPTIKFTAASNGNNQTFTDANISNFNNTTAYSSVYRNGILIDNSQYTFAGSTLTINVVLLTGDTIYVASTAVAASTFSGNGTVGGANTQVQFNDAGNFAGSSAFVFNKNTSVLTVSSLSTTTGTITTGNITTINSGLLQNGNSNITITSNANVTITAKSNATMVISDTGANITGTGNFSGNVSVANLIGPHANGNSNVNIPAANGNVNISAVGNANILVVTGTGVNVSGTLNATGNITGNTNGYTIGYLNIPQVAASNTTLALTDAGKHYYSTTAGNLTLTVPNNATVGFATGTAITIVVQAAGNILVNAASGVTLYLAGSSTAGNRVISTYGMATIMKVATDTWFLSGVGTA